MSAPVHRYVACGLQIDSAVPISHLPPGNRKLDADLQISAGGAAPEFVWAVSTPQWRASGHAVQLFGMHGETCICTAGEHIHFYGVSATLDETFTLLGRALAVACMQRGLLVLHAAVLERDGVAFAIAGRSGAGKSTLVMEFARRGYRVVADDIAACDIGQGMLHARPLYPVTRRRTQTGGDGWKPIPGLDKQVSTNVPFCPEPRVIAHLLVLGVDRAGGSGANFVEVASDARGKVIEDQLYRRGIARHCAGFAGLRREVARVADGLPVSRVARPEHGDPSVLADAIERHLERT